ncbi:MAG TPA: UDP-N-acetylglucosamine 1-carboxyvinyltransferase [Chitinivibrionales bacterium]|nr:UDP-N-acetylglucosamine 1-carboxyvinyltransferase [Chitinivibrionales bacterium]
MSSFIVEGGVKLQGTIRTAGNKNEALPVIAAALLCHGSVTLSNVPDIGDVRSMLSIASLLGAKISEINNSSVCIDATAEPAPTLPADLSSIIRGSILFASSLLARTGKAVIPQPGGDSIGRRRLDTHFHVFKALGAKMTAKHYQKSSNSEQVLYVLEAKKGLRGTDICLDEASVTATENAVIAAAGARGRTTIVNAASEPHVQGLCRFLEKSGVKIEGIGSNVLSIYGSGGIEGAPHTLGSDYIETGSFIGLAAATRSEITITNIDPQHMKMILFQFARLGIQVEVDQNQRTLMVPGHQTMKIRQDLGGAIPKIEDNIWPAFPADLMSIMIVAATQASGTCLLHEKMFESRLFFVDKLISMGAKIVICDPHRAVVNGPSQLVGATISSPDIRAGMALLIAACAARGKSCIQNIEQIDRGYENIDQRLSKLGARIIRTAERRKNWPTTGKR